MFMKKPIRKFALERSVAYGKTLIKSSVGIRKLMKKNGRVYQVGARFPDGDVPPGAEYCKCVERFGFNKIACIYNTPLGVPKGVP